MKLLFASCLVLLSNISIRVNAEGDLEWRVENLKKNISGALNDTNGFVRKEVDFAIYRLEDIHDRANKSIETVKNRVNNSQCEFCIIPYESFIAYDYKVPLNDAAFYFTESYNGTTKQTVEQLVAELDELDVLLQKISECIRNEDETCLKDMSAVADSINNTFRNQLYSIESIQTQFSKNLSQTTMNIQYTMEERAENATDCFWQLLNVTDGLDEMRNKIQKFDRMKSELVISEVRHFVENIEDLMKKSIAYVAILAKNATESGVNVTNCEIHELDWQLGRIESNAVRNLTFSFNKSEEYVNSSIASLAQYERDLSQQVRNCSNINCIRNVSSSIRGNKTKELEETCIDRMYWFKTRINESSEENLIYYSRQTYRAVQNVTECIKESNITSDTLKKKLRKLYEDITYVENATTVEEMNRTKEFNLFMSEEVDELTRKFIKWNETINDIKSSLGNFQNAFCNKSVVRLIYVNEVIPYILNTYNGSFHQNISTLFRKIGEGRSNLTEIARKVNDCLNNTACLQSVGKDIQYFEKSFNITRFLVEIQFKISKANRDMRREIENVKVEIDYFGKISMNCFDKLRNAKENLEKIDSDIYAFKKWKYDLRDIKTRAITNFGSKLDADIAEKNSEIEKYLDAAEQSSLNISKCKVHDLNWEFEKEAIRNFNESIIEIETNIDYSIKNISVYKDEQLMKLRECFNLTCIETIASNSQGEEYQTLEKKCIDEIISFKNYTFSLVDEEFERYSYQVDNMTKTIIRCIQAVEHSREGLATALQTMRKYNDDVMAELNELETNTTKQYVNYTENEVNKVINEFKKWEDDISVEKWSTIQFRCALCDNLLDKLKDLEVSLQVSLILYNETYHQYISTIFSKFRNDSMELKRINESLTECDYREECLLYIYEDIEQYKKVHVNYRYLDEVRSEIDVAYRKMRNQIATIANDLNVRGDNAMNCLIQLETVKRSFDELNLVISECSDEESSLIKMKTDVTANYSMKLDLKIEAGESQMKILVDQAGHAGVNVSQCEPDKYELYLEKLIEASSQDIIKQIDEIYKQTNHTGAEIISYRSHLLAKLRYCSDYKCIENILSDIDKNKIEKLETECSEQMIQFKDKIYFSSDQSYTYYSSMVDEKVTQLTECIHQLVE